MLNRIIFFLLVLVSQHVVYAQDNSNVTPHAKIFPALLFIEGKGVDENGIPFKIQGSGVVVTKEGLALTSFHVLAPLSKSSNPPILRARLSLKTGLEFAYETKTSLVDRDIQLIQLVGTSPFTPPPCFDSDPLKNGDIVYTSGFPANLHYVMGSGEVATLAGPRGTVIANLRVSESQSGSPVYGPSGRIVGIIKGSYEGDELRAVIIPTSDFAHLLPKAAKNCPLSDVLETKPKETFVFDQEKANRSTVIKKPNARVKIAGSIIIGNKDLVIHAKEIVALPGAEIRGFSPGSTAVSGNEGVRGTDGESASSRSGKDGTRGLPGKNGIGGTDGNQSGSVTIEAGIFSGELVVDVSGQGGGDGGRGGPGGDGGDGADGRNSVDGLFNCNRGPGNGGDGGSAGAGGNGGRGGNGGDGGLANIKVGLLTPDSRISIQSVGGLGGIGGKEGSAGSPGKAGSRGSTSAFCGAGGRGAGNAGQTARDGTPGRDGENGSRGIIAVQIGTQSKVTSGKCLITGNNVCF